MCVGEGAVQILQQCMQLQSNPMPNGTDFTGNKQIVIQSGLAVQSLAACGGGIKSSPTLMSQNVFKKVVPGCWTTIGFQERKKENFG